MHVERRLTHKPDDSKEDPRHEGNQIDSLLDGDKGTILLLMGLEIRSPKPKLAPDKIGAFNAIEAMQQSVFGAKEITKFPRFDDQSSDWSATQSDSKSPAQYDAVKRIWGNSLLEGSRKVIVDDLAQALGWSHNITAVSPTRLVNSLEERYMLAPKISVEVISRF